MVEPLPAREYDAVVVGGGMAGLACATRLAERGRRVALCERRALLGGRASSWHDDRLGAVIDNGPHLWAGAYREVAALLERVGARTAQRLPSRLSVPLLDAAGERALLAWGTAPGLAGLAQGFARFRVLTRAERLRLSAVPAACVRRPPHAEMALGEWLALLGQGERARRWLWDPLARAVFSEDPERVSARLFRAVVRHLLLAGPAEAALAPLTGGLSAAYARPAASYLEARGGAALRRAGAHAVRATDGGFAIELAGGRELSARALCLAVPPRRALALLGPEAETTAPGLTAAAAAAPSPIVTVYLRLAGPEPLLAEPFAGFVDSVFAWCFDRPAAAGRDRLVALVAPGARALLDEDGPTLAAAATEALVAHLPAARGRRVVCARAVKEPRAAPSLTPAAAAARPDNRTTVPGLALAGDWTDTGLPATLEGAAASGHAAARALDAHLARRRARSPAGP